MEREKAVALSQSLHDAGFVHTMRAVQSRDQENRPTLMYTVEIDQQTFDGAELEELGRQGEGGDAEDAQ
jgi:hypothetical protein